MADNDQTFALMTKEQEESHLNNEKCADREDYDDQGIEVRKIIPEDTLCGIGSFKPQWLQRFATPFSYLILYSIIGVLQGSYYSYLISTITTLEKRFAFKSKISGVIMMVDEITPLVLGVLVGYFGGRTHRPRIVGVGMFLSVLCCFLSALPYFIYGPATHLTHDSSHSVSNYTGPQVCDYQPKKEECDEDDRPPTVSAVVFLVVGSFLKGFGNLSYYAVGLAYMDDNAKKKNAPIYFAVSFALRLFGPTVGFLMSSAFLKIYENPFETPDFSTDDPRWIGAWWLGFVLQGVLLLIFSSPVILFPRRLPRQRRRAFSNTERFDQENLKEKISGLFRALRRLSKNPIFVWYTIGSILRINGGFGYYIMLPKYMETEFRMSASDASLYSGPPALIAITVSAILGGCFIWKFRPGPRLLVGLMVFMEIVSTFGYFFLMIFSCHDLVMTGTTSTSEGLDLTNECNKDCLCATDVFTPLCAPDGYSTYFSACHAGCNAWNDTNVTESFSDCACIRNTSGNYISVQSIDKGFCEIDNCWSQAIGFIILLPILSGITSTFRVAHTIVLLRSVEPQDKSVALGTFEAFLSLLGFIPYPVIYGALVDSACLVWEKSCGKTGNCWLYDIRKLRYLLHIVSSGLCAGGVLCDIAVFCLSHRLKNLYDEENDETDADADANPKPSSMATNDAELKDLSNISEKGPT